MRIPWAKPSITDAERQAVMACFDTDWLTMGPKTQELEARARALTEAPYAIAVNSGTAALDLALKLAGAGPGDEVIIPALAYIATGAAVLYQSATPIFVDIDPSTYNLDPDRVRTAITPRTRAIIAIDYAGHSADWATLNEIAAAAGIALVEDGAPGLGGRYQGDPLCTRAEFGITSFHMAKTLSAVEGGMLFVRSAEHDRVARMMRSQGEDPASKYSHPVLGHNYRLSDLHAAVGCAQLARAPEIYARRQQIAAAYSAALASCTNIVCPSTADGCDHAYFLYPVLVADRDAVRERLAADGIDSNVSWPVPIYRQGAFAQYPATACPVAEAFTASVLCLPMYFDMTDRDIKDVVDALIQATA